MKMCICFTHVMYHLTNNFGRNFAMYTSFDLRESEILTPKVMTHLIFHRARFDYVYSIRILTVEWVSNAQERNSVAWLIEFTPSR